MYLVLTTLTSSVVFSCRCLGKSEFAQLARPEPGIRPRQTLEPELLMTTPPRCFPLTGAAADFRHLMSHALAFLATEPSY